jgi:hypothetical protein
LFGSTCVKPESPYGPWPSDYNRVGGVGYHGEPEQYGLNNNLQYGEHNMQNGFTWFWRANEWYPWRLPNATDYMYSSYHVGSAYRRDPGVYDPKSFGQFIACGDAPSIHLEPSSWGFSSDPNPECRFFFGNRWGCSDETYTNYSFDNCSGSCGVCTMYCYDTDINGRTNTHGYGCEIYNEMPVLCDIAESYDDDDFDASFHCCVCGGGSRNVCEPDD